MERFMAAGLAVMAVFLIVISIDASTQAFGFGGDSFGNGKATPTPTPAPAATPTPTPTPTPAPAANDDSFANTRTDKGRSGVVDTNNQRCVDRNGIVTDQNNCRGQNGNYHWYYGGVGLNIGDKVDSGSFTSSTDTIATPTATPSPKAGHTLPFTMYNDTTVKTCVNNKEQVVSSDSCDEKDKHWYYYPLRKGGKLYDLGEKVSGGTSKKPPETDQDDNAAAPVSTPTPADENPPRDFKQGVDFEFTNLTKNNQVRACVSSNALIVTGVAACKTGIPGYLWYYYIPTQGKIFIIREVATGGSFDPADPIATGGSKSGPEPAVPPSAATPEPPTEPKLALAKDNDDKLRPLTPDDIELVGKYAAVAAKPLEEMTPKVWQAAVRHQYALAFSKPIWPLALAGIAFWWVFFIKSRWHIHDGCEDEERWLYLACVYIAPPVVTLVFGTIGLVRLSTSIARLVAPEYYAIMDFVQTLVK